MGRRGRERRIKYFIRMVLWKGRSSASEILRQDCVTLHMQYGNAHRIRVYIYIHIYIYKLAYAPQSRRRSAYSGPMITHDGRLPGMQFAVAYAPCHASSAVGQRTLSLSPIPSRPVGHVVSHTSKAGEFCMMTLTVSIHRYIYNTQLSSERWAEAVNIP